MRRVLLLFLICASLTASHIVVAQNAFTPISRSSYDRNQEFFDKYFDDYSLVFVNFMMSYSLMSQPFEALNIRMSPDKCAGIITVRTEKKEFSMECSPELYSSLVLLTKHAVNTASFTMDRGGLDGADYYLFLNDYGVTGWSPVGLPQDACSLFEHIGTSVMAGDRDRLESFTAVADWLYHAFKANYHENMVRTDYGVSWGAYGVHTLSLFADLGFDVSSMLTYQQFFDLGGFQLKLRLDDDDLERYYYQKYESLLRELAYWAYVQSDFADDSNYATFIVDDSVSAPMVKEESSCRFEIRLRESDLEAEKMISLLKGIHKDRLVHFIAGDVLRPAGSTSITIDEVRARLDESFHEILLAPIPEPMKERLGYESHPKESAAVDLGLSVKWAPFNIGAEKPEEHGDYFAWGETDTKSRYDSDNYIFRESGEFREIKFNKYNTDSERGIVDGRTGLEPEDDAAHVKWGGNWRMPTKAEWDELRENCTWTWTTVKGMNGYKITSNKPGYKNRSIFLSAAGYCGGQYMAHSDYEDTDYMSWYWSSTLAEASNYSESVVFNSEFITEGGSRTVGASIRPVVPANKKK